MRPLLGLAPQVLRASWPFTNSLPTAVTVGAIPTKEARRVSLADVQADWTVLDDPNLDLPLDVRLISHERFTACPEIPVEYIEPGPLARLARFLPALFNFFYAWQLLRACDTRTVLIVNGGTGIWLFVGLLNRALYRCSRRVLCWDVFVEVEGGWRRRVVSMAMRGITLAVLWSRAQIKPHAEFLGLPEERFVFLPYKANHSKGPRYDLSIGRYVFSGGNGKRDYRCLIEAVRGTGIPVIISATDPEVRKSIEPLPNVIVLGAAEPAFAQLQAAAEFVVIPMVHTGLKGGGEANFCNAMWHGKPIIAADSIAAADYIIEGETGYVVPSGNTSLLRTRITALWGDPSWSASMGAAAARHAAATLTHRSFVKRLLSVARVVP